MIRFNSFFRIFYPFIWIFFLHRLDLDSWINDPPSSSSDEESIEDVNNKLNNLFVSGSEEAVCKPSHEPSPEEISKVFLCVFGWVLIS